MTNTLQTEMQNLLAQYEKTLKNMQRDQKTDDAMDSKKFKGMEETYTAIIEDLKRVLKNPFIFPE